MAFYNLTSDAEFQGATVIFGDGSTRTIGADNPNFQKVRDGLLDGSLSDDQLLELIAPFEAIYKKLTKLSERVSRKGARLFFDGDPVAHRLAQHIISIMDSEADDAEWQAWIKFWEKAATNPSLQGQDEFFVFVEKHGLQITPDGDAVLYKGVRADWLSSHAGPGIVDGVEFEHANLPNKVGSTVEIPRSKVDPNRREACSTGLHVGDFSYANSFAPKLLLVLVNPRDVVSVPSDANERKIRVCRYLVLSENTEKKKLSEGQTVIPFSELGLPDPEEPTEIENPETTEVEETEAPQTIKVNVTKRKIETPAPAATGGSRVEEYKTLIKSGGAGKDLKKYRNKRVTPGRRAEFDQAVTDLGLQY